MQAFFPKEHRLRTSKQYQSVFRNPKKFFSECFLVLVMPTGLPHARLGLVIKKRYIKHAVQRNTLKRVIRESFRVHFDLVLTGLDMVVIVHKLLPPKKLAEQLDRQWKNILTYYRKS